MKNSVICKVLCAALVLPVCLAAAPKRGVVEEFKPEQIDLRNKYVSVSIAPAALGRVVSVKLNATGAEMLNPTRLTRLWMSPLHEIRGDNFQGIRELFWRGTVNGSIAMQVVKKTPESITLHSKSYGASCFEMSRTISLLPEGSGFVWETTLTNRSAKKEICNLWYNFQGATPALARIPVAGGKHPVRGKGTADYPRDFMFTHGVGEYFLPPGADFAGFVEPETKAVWVAVFPHEELSPDGLFYSWGNRSPNSIRTAEPVLKSRTLNPGEKVVSKMTILVFNALDDFSGIVGSSAFEFRRSGGKLLVRISNAVPRPAENLEIVINGKEKFSFDLPARKTATLIEKQLDYSGIPETGFVKLGKDQGKLFFPLPEK